MHIIRHSHIFKRIQILSPCNYIQRLTWEGEENDLLQLPKWGMLRKRLGNRCCTCICSELGGDSEVSAHGPVG